MGIAQTQARKPAREKGGFSDTSRLKEVVVTGYGTNRPLMQTPASIVPLSSTDFHRFSGNSLVPVFDQAPGVDFQERSPGNYRLSIRGSTLRAAFNVRNVKVYWDGIPFTDGGGTSWLTPLDPHVLSGAEIIKGPTSSTYGAGTGGTILLKSMLASDSGRHVQLDLQGGSYALRGLNLALSSLDKNNSSYLNYSDLQSGGYRANSALGRQIIHFSTRFSPGPKDELRLSSFYADLRYQVPGGLNLAQYKADPSQARPASKVFPSAITQKTGEHIQKFFLGLSNRYSINPALDNLTSLVLTPDVIYNSSVPAIQRTAEQNFALRTETRYHFSNASFSGKISAGAELTYSTQTDRDYGNLRGQVDSLQRDDELRNLQWFAFSQLELNFNHNYFFTLGASYNQVRYNILRLYERPALSLQTRFKPIISPRVALLKAFSPSQTVYASFSFGYSPPASGEVLPSTGIFNTSLQAEKAQDLEIGYRGNFADHLLDVDFTLFRNQIKHSIIRRTDSLGRDFYLNAGSSVEKGVEALLRISPIRNSSSRITYLSAYANVTANDFYFSEYILNGQNLSGNPYTGVAPWVLASGLDARTRAGLYANFNYHYSDQIPLNDQNTVRAQSYSIFGGKLGYSRQLRRQHRFDLYLGVDNLLNKHYSLGNDINATAGRYFNPASMRNYYFGLSLHY